MASDPLAAIVKHLYEHADIGGRRDQNGDPDTWVQAPHLTQPLSDDWTRAVTIEDSGQGGGLGQLSMARYASGRFDVLCLAERADLAKQLALDVEAAIIQLRGQTVEYGAGVPRPNVRFVNIYRSGGFLSLIDDVQKWPVCFAAYTYNSS